MGITITSGIGEGSGISKSPGLTQFTGLTNNGGYTPLSNYVSSTVFDLDATIAASYTAGQTWFNLINAPADGSAKAAYDFFLGATGTPSTDDPTFNGTPGNSSCFWSFDGGDIFSLKSGTNTTLLNALHKTTGGTDFWMALAYRPVDGGAIRLIATQNAAGSQGATMNQSSSEAVQLVQGDGTVNAQSSGGITVTPGTDYVMIISIAAGGGAMRYWTNSGTKTTGSITYGTTTTDAVVPLRIGPSATAGTLIYAASMGNAFIDDAQALQILNLYRQRHRRNYT